MNLHNQSAWETILEHWVLIWTIIATLLMAALRTAKQTGKVDYIEAGMCSLFSVGIWFMLDWLGLPSEAGIGIGVFIAYIGTLRFSTWIRNKLDME